MVLPASILSASWSLLASLVILGLEPTGATPVSLGTDQTDSLKELSKRARIWQPAVGASWQIVLLNPLKITDKHLSPNAQIWDLDLYDNSANTFSALRKRGKKVICYLSAGSWEAWRNDAPMFKKSDLGKQVEGWPRERWLNTSSPSVRTLMKQRISLAARKGCDAIDPDNTNGYENETGFRLKKADSVDYVKFLAETAASYGLAMGLKNSPDIIPQVLSYVQFSVVESCTRYSECAMYQPFIQANKPVFEIEYPGSAGTQVSADTMNTICPGSNNLIGNDKYSVVMKNLTLDGWSQYCSGEKTYTTATVMPQNLWVKVGTVVNFLGYPKREIQV